MTDSAPRPGLAIGDFAPNFALPDAAGKVTMLLERTSGRPVVLALLPAGPDLAQRLECLAGWQPAVADAGADLMAVAEGPAAAPQRPPPPFHLWSDPYGKVLGGYQAALAQVRSGPQDLKQAALAFLVLDPNQRLEAVLSVADFGATTPEVCGEVLVLLRQMGSRLPMPAERVNTAFAPVLVLPRLLALDDATGLAKLDPTAGHGTASGAAGDDPWPEPVLDAAQEALGLSGDGRSLAARDRELARDLQMTIGQRLAVQLEKAYQFGGFRLLPPRLVAFPGDRRQIAPVRLASLANWSPRVRFIVLIGIGPAGSAPAGLVFPEYGTRVHRLELGDALVFSTSLAVANRGCGDDGNRALLLAVARQ